MATKQQNVCHLLVLFLTIVIYSTTAQPAGPVPQIDSQVKVFSAYCRAIIISRLLILKSVSNNFRKTLALSTIPCRLTTGNSSMPCNTIHHVLLKSHLTPSMSAPWTDTNYTACFGLRYLHILRHHNTIRSDIPRPP